MSYSNITSLTLCEQFEPLVEKLLYLEYHQLMNEAIEAGNTELVYYLQRKGIEFEHCNFNILQLEKALDMGIIPEDKYSMFIHYLHKKEFDKAKLVYRYIDISKLDRKRLDLLIREISKYGKYNFDEVVDKLESKKSELESKKNDKDQEEINELLDKYQDTTLSEIIKRLQENKNNAAIKNIVSAIKFYQQYKTNE